MASTYFTADTHFGHKNILRLGHGRPFDSIEEHDQTLIDNWNRVVKQADRLFFLGDFSFYGRQRTVQTLKRLNGTIHWIRGNHDPKTNPDPTRVAAFRDMDELTVGSGPDRQLIVLCHYPLLTWNREHHGSWTLHGHSHGNLVTDNTARLDIGVDVWNYAPVSYEQIAEEMRTRTFTAVDHHGNPNVDV